ncbi:MAG: T9SS type A sorting domain-containing protein [Flavobacteriales bacterium]|nr:T9SS type A sorting domain-containing protein [Flavobacteriales bacterium]
MSGCAFWSNLDDKKDTRVNRKNLLTKMDRTDLAIEQEFYKTRDLTTNTVPREQLFIAQQYQYNLFNRLNKASIPGINWTERGPSNIGGRTRAILWDKNDPTGKTVFVAGVAGGLWKTTNIFANEVTWEKVNDFLDNLAICAIAQDPLRPDTMYLGTGEGFFNFDAVQGNGIFKSTDGGKTFTLLNSTLTTNLSSCAGTGNCDFTYVNKIVVTNNGTVLAACRSHFTNRGGVMRSVNAGASFSRIIPANTPYKAADLEIAANGDIFAAIGLTSTSGPDFGIWKSTNDGASFTKVYSAASNERRIEIACAPSDSNYIYAITQNSVTSRANAVLRSTNGGGSWSNISVPLSISSSDTFTSRQAWYNLLLAVNPNDRDSVIIGGIDLYRTSNAGSSWSQLTHWTGQSGYQPVHSDQHIAAFKPGSGNIALIGNDGGLYLVTDLTSAKPYFKKVNSGYNVTQFYSCAINPTRYSNNFIGGTQDNGTISFSQAGEGPGANAAGGDGGFTHIDRDNPDYQFSAYTNTQLIRSTDGGKSFSDFFTSSTGKFINPSDYDNKNKILYTGYNSGNYKRFTNMTGTIATATVSAGFSGQVSAVTVDTFVNNRVYFGTDNGKIYRVTNAHSSPTISNITPASMSAGAYVTCIAIDRKNPAHLLATVSNYNTNNVYESTNTGSSWTVCDGNLPNIPVRWAMFSPLGGDSALIATELGVWSTDNLNGGSTNWSTSNNGLSNVRVDMLKLRESDSLVLAATHGRGMFTTDIFTTPKVDFTALEKVAYIGEPIQFNDDSYKATSWAWDFNNDGITDATIPNPSYAYGTSGYKSVKLTINGTLSVVKSKYVHILPNMSTPYSPSDGGNFDDTSKYYHFGSKAIEGNFNIWERGIPSNTLTTTNSSPNAWKTDLDADITKADYVCGLYSPNFNFTFPGTYKINFRKSMAIYYCNAPFAVRVEYSTNKGESWQRLGVNGMGTSWYNKYPGASCEMASPIFDDLYAWIGNYSNSFTEYDVSFLSGNKDVAFRFVLSVVGRYSDIGYAKDGFMIDDFTITGPSNPVLPAEIETVVSSQTLPIGGNSTVDFYSPNGKIIATIKNNDSHDYGNTKVEIDSAGYGTVNFSTNTEKGRRILQKTILITPANSNSSGNVDISMYFDKIEKDTFETTTTYASTTMNLLKTPGALHTTGTLLNTINGSTPAVSPYLDGVKVTSSFSNGFSGLGVGTNGINGPLPVTWLTFNGKRDNNSALLYWKTASEINNSHFEIERLIEGDLNFETVGSVKGAGTVMQITNYSYKDLLPPIANGKTVYYRLRQVDFDGDYDRSNTIALYYIKNLYNVAIYPNPGDILLNIEIEEHLVHNSRLEIYDPLGLKVYSSELENAINVINTEAFKSGIYYLTVYQNNEPVLYEKWIKK